MSCNVKGSLVKLKIMRVNKTRPLFRRGARAELINVIMRAALERSHGNTNTPGQKSSQCKRLNSSLPWVLVSVGRSAEGSGVLWLVLQRVLVFCELVPQRVLVFWGSMASSTEGACVLGFCKLVPQRVPTVPANSTLHYVKFRIGILCDLAANSL